MAYIHRVLEGAVRKYLKIFPVVGLTGPRQSGKSTLIKNLLDDKYRYVTFDDLTNVDRFHSDPAGFMRVYSDKVIFDEVQRAPELFSYVKLAVDSDREHYGKFVLTGSSQFAFMKRVSESLAGRIGLLTLLPFQFAEMPVSFQDTSIFMGGYPELVTRKYKGSFDWYTSYLDTYLTRDIRDQREIGDIRDFRLFLQMLATRASQVLNMSEVARDIGISVPTVKKWISVLEASYVVFLLPPFYKNLGKRIVKSPKLYFYDTGMVSYLTGIRNTELFERGPMQGPIFENYIVSEIHKKELHIRSGAELYYFRTSNGVEIDLIVDRKTEKHFIEIKTGETYKSEMVRGIMQIKKPDEVGYLLYRGKNLDSSRDLKVINYREYLKL
ncbi:MAG: ATP-binding protein [Bacteroidota bacterium]|jgi:predicted AAA+ superfamily ATPase